MESNDLETPYKYNIMIKYAKEKITEFRVDERRKVNTN